MPKSAASTSSTVATTTVPKSGAAPPTTTTTPANICNSTNTTAQAEYDPPNGNKYGVTPPQDDNARRHGGPAQLQRLLSRALRAGSGRDSGNIVKTATADLDSQTDEWEVVLDFTGFWFHGVQQVRSEPLQVLRGGHGQPPLLRTAGIELDGTVESAPSIDSNNFPGSAEISGSSSAPFTQQEAQSLAQALSYGSLPVRFVAQDIDNVSPQIGTDSLSWRDSRGIAFSWSSST